MTATAATGTVYALVDPRDQKTRYIGATTRPLRVRLDGHLSRPARRVRVWIAELRAAGLRPLIVPLREHVPAADLSEAETAEITRFLADGVPLLNEMSVARGQKVNSARVEHERKAAWHRFAVLAPGILGGPMPPGDVPLVEIPDPLWEFVGMLGSGHRERMEALIRPGQPRETEAERYRIWRHWEQTEEDARRYLKEAVRGCWTELRSTASDVLAGGIEEAFASVLFRPWPHRADASRALSLVPWFVTAVEPWRRLAELGSLPLEDEPFITWVARDAGTREALEFLSAAARRSGVLSRLGSVAEDRMGFWVSATGSMLAATAAAYSSAELEAPVHDVISHALQRLADDHMLTKPMADLLLRLNPRALDLVFGPDIAAEMDRDLGVSEGTSARVLRELVERFYLTGPVRRAADRSTQQFPLSALPDYRTWTGPVVPAARAISGALVHAGLAAPEDCTVDEYLAKVRELWMPVQARGAEATAA